MNGVLVQFISAFILSLGCYQSSVMMVWPSYVSPVLKNSTILDEPFTDTHMALLGSLPMLGCLIATLIGGLIWERLGRKYTMALGSLLFMLAWTIITTTRSIKLILAARLIDGIGGGLILALGTMIVGEISLPRIRGVLTTIPTLMFNIGTLASYILGWMFTYKVINLINLCFCALIVCLTLTIRESPVYLVQKGKEKEALKSLRFYRGSAASEEELLEELAAIKSLVGKPYELAATAENGTIDEKAELQLNATNSKGPGTKNTWVLLFTTPSYRRAFFTLLFLFLGLVFVGTMAIYAYAGTFFMRAVPSLSPHLCSIILAVSNTIGCFISMSITDRLGRRVLIISSSAMVCACLMTLASILAWAWAPDWAVPALMLLSCFCLHFGFGPVPAILIGEYFVPEVKTLATSIALCMMWLSNFGLLASFTTMVYYLGLGGTFFLFSLVAGSVALVSFLVVPETSGLTTQEIQELFSSGVFHFRSKNK